MEKGKLIERKDRMDGGGEGGFPPEAAGRKVLRGRERD